MENKFERIIENLEEEETLTLGDQTFLNEMILDESIQCSILGTLTFFEVDFKRVDFTGSTFVNCEFKNCRFKDVILRKCEFWNPTFENCQIERSNLTRANFHKGTFRNCIFIKSNLTASNFSEFEFSDNPDVRLDFEATDIKTGKRIFMDHKGMIDFQSLADQGKNISRFPSHETVAYRMGQEIPSQKERFVGLPQGPKSANEVLHLVNFDKIRNSLEKPSLVSAVLNGAEDTGCGDNIAFINFE